MLYGVNLSVGLIFLAACAWYTEQKPGPTVLLALNMNAWLVPHVQLTVAVALVFWSFRFGGVYSVRKPDTLSCSST
jgi:ABC-type spermidine/putrescine transport system permease subunit II